MKNIRWYAMPVGFFGRMSVAQIKMRFKAEGIAVMVMLLDAIALSNGRIRGALNSSDALDPNFLATVAELSGARPEVVEGVVGVLVDDGLLSFDEGGLGCCLIDESISDQEECRKKNAEKQARFRQKSNGYSNGYVTVSNLSSNRPVTVSHLSSNRPVTGKVINKEINKEIKEGRNIESDGAADAAPILSAIVTKLKNRGGMQ